MIVKLFLLAFIITLVILAVTYPFTHGMRRG